MLYRKQRGPVSLWLTLGTGIVGLLLGFVGGRSTAPQPTLQGLLQPAGLHLRQAAGALDIVDLEYARALGGSLDSQQASLKAAAQAQAEVSQAELLRQLYPEAFTQADRALAEVSQAIRLKRPRAEVARHIQATRALLTNVTSSLPR